MVVLSIKIIWISEDIAKRPHSCSCIAPSLHCVITGCPKFGSGKKLQTEIYQEAQIFYHWDQLEHFLSLWSIFAPSSACGPLWIFCASLGLIFDLLGLILRIRKLDQLVVADLYLWFKYYLQIISITFPPDIAHICNQRKSISAGTLVFSPDPPR